MPVVISEIESLLALNKPAGLITHSDGRTVESSVAEWIAERYPEMVAVGEAWVSPQGESVHMCGLVHRLDRMTSGVILAAKTQEMYDYLKAEFKARRVEKKYRAVVHGHLEQDTGRIVARIERTNTIPKRWEAVLCDESHIRAAITDYVVLSRGLTPEGEPYSYMELSPKTGRTHQIRVHLSSIGHPLVGDRMYAPAREPILGFTRPALHACAISFVAPDGQTQTYGAPLPDDFRIFEEKMTLPN